MANTSGLTNKVAMTPWTTDRRLELGATTVAATTFFYDGQAVGRDKNGTMVNIDDTAQVEFLGILMSVVDKQQVNSTDVSGQTIFRVVQPLMFTANLTGAATGDEGRRTYWQFNETLAYNGLVNFNYAGYVWEVLQPTGQSTVTQVTVLPPWMSRPMGNSANALIPLQNSGTVTFTKYSVGSDYSWNDTASLTLNLPAAATVSPGDQFTIIKIGSGADTVQFKPNGTDSINQSTATFNSSTTQYNRTVAETDGVSQWYIHSY